MSDMDSLNGEGDDIEMKEILNSTSEEEGEICDTDEEKGNSGGNIKKHTFMRGGLERTDHSIFDDEELAIMGERVDKFGTAEEAGLYVSLGVGEGSEGRRHTRLDTIHMYGTQHMDTNDVFQYFYSHKPLFLEWVNDSCCNVVWQDDISAARAMIFYSKEGKGEHGSPPGKWRIGAPHPKADCIFLRFATRSDKKVTGKDKLKVLSKKYKDPTEVSHTGLISKSMKSQIKSIESDPYGVEEETNKNPWGELCQTWGINDAQEVFGVPSYKHPSNDLPARQSSLKNRIGPPMGRVTAPVKTKDQVSLKMRLGKRTVPVEDEVIDSWHDEEEPSSEEEWTSRSKVPRMRMHADDEQEKIERNRSKANISIITVEVNNEARGDMMATQRHRGRSRQGHSKGDLRARLRRRQADQSQSSESEEESSTVWARLDVPHSRVKEEFGSSSDDDDVRYAVSKTSPRIPLRRPGFQKTDLRSRIGNKKVPGSPLRIEVDNEHYIQSD